MQVLVKVALFASLGAGIYYSTYSWLIQYDWPREDYSYCYMMAPIVLYLIWEKKRELAVEASTPSWGGLFLLIPGICLFWVGDLAGELYSLYLSSWLVAVGILWMLIGWRKLKVIAFPLFMGLTLFPLPHFLNTKLTFGLKLISSKLGVLMLHLYGMSAYREGNVIDLGFTQLQVVDACSGLRYLFPLVIMGILLAYFYRASIWKRLLLVLSAIPLSIVINSLRIALTGMIYSHWGAKMAEGFFHGFSGWLIFMFSFAVLLSEIWVLRRITPRPGEAFFGRNETKPAIADNVKLFAPNKGWKALFAPPQFVVAAVLLLLTMVVSAAVEFREKVPAGKPFGQFPLTVGTWEGTRQYMEQKFITSLDLSDYTMIDFKSDGKHVDFYIAYYQSQRKGESIHSPETCLPGSGWEFKQAGKARVPLEDSERSIPVNRAFMEMSGQRQLAYFWFPARGRVLTNAYEMKLYTFWDALTRQRTDGALVRLITPVYANEHLEEAEARLQEFTKEIVPILDEYIPK